MNKISYIDNIDEWRTDFSFKIPIKDAFPKQICLDM